MVDLSPQNPGAPTLVFLFGFLGKEPSAEYTRALELQKEHAGTQRQVVIVGDGMTPITIQQIREALKTHNEPLDVIISAHGGNFGNSVPTGSDAFANLNNQYLLSFDSGKSKNPNGAHVYVDINDGQKLAIPTTDLVPAQDVLKAMPPSTRGVFLGSCGSEEALQFADLLPKGAYLFPSSRIGHITDQGFAQSIRNNNNQTISGSNGTQLNRSFTNFIAADVVPKTYDPKTNSYAPDPAIDKYAISGQGIVDLSQLATNMRGHVFSAQAIQETANIFSPNVYRKTGYRPPGERTPGTIDTIEGVRGYIEKLAANLTNGTILNDHETVGIMGKNIEYPDGKIVWNATYSRQVALALVSNEIEYLASKDGEPVSKVIARLKAAGAAPAPAIPASSSGRSPLGLLKAIDPGPIAATISSNPPMVAKKTPGVSQKRQPTMAAQF